MINSLKAEEPAVGPRIELPSKEPFVRDNDAAMVEIGERIVKDSEDDSNSLKNMSNITQQSSKPKEGIAWVTDLSAEELKTKFLSAQKQIISLQQSLDSAKSTIHGLEKVMKHMQETRKLLMAALAVSEPCQKCSCDTDSNEDCSDSSSDDEKDVFV